MSDDLHAWQEQLRRRLAMKRTLDRVWESQTIEGVREGDCFEKALEVCRDNPGSIIVHGLPLGQGTYNKGKRFWHAWVELEVYFLGNITISWVLDLANNRGIEMPAVQYYNIGHIEQTWRFTLEDAHREMSTRMHYGPWVDNYEEKEEV